MHLSFTSPKGQGFRDPQFPTNPWDFRWSADHRISAGAWAGKFGGFASAFRRAEDSIARIRNGTREIVTSQPPFARTDGFIYPALRAFQLCERTIVPDTRSFPQMSEARDGNEVQSRRQRETLSFTVRSSGAVSFSPSKISIFRGEGKNETHSREFSKSNKKGPRGYDWEQHNSLGRETLGKSLRRLVKYSRSLTKRVSGDGISLKRRPLQRPTLLSREKERGRGVAFVWIH